MLSTLILIAVIVWAIKELAEGLGIKCRIERGGKNNPSNGEN